MKWGQFRKLTPVGCSEFISREAPMALFWTSRLMNILKRVCFGACKHIRWGCETPTDSQNTSGSSAPRCERPRVPAALFLGREQSSEKLKSSERFSKRPENWTPLTGSSLLSWKLFHLFLQDFALVKSRACGQSSHNRHFYIYFFRKHFWLNFIWM